MQSLSNQILTSPDLGHPRPKLGLSETNSLLLAGACACCHLSAAEANASHRVTVSVTPITESVTLSPAVRNPFDSLSKPINNPEQTHGEPTGNPRVTHLVSAGRNASTACVPHLSPTCPQGQASRVPDLSLTRHARVTHASRYLRDITDQQRHLQRLKRSCSRYMQRHVKRHVTPCNAPVTLAPLVNRYQTVTSPLPLRECSVVPPESSEVLRNVRERSRLFERVRLNVDPTSGLHRGCMVLARCLQAAPKALPRGLHGASTGFALGLPDARHNLFQARLLNDRSTAVQHLMGGAA